MAFFIVTAVETLNLQVYMFRVLRAVVTNDEQTGNMQACNIPVKSGKIVGVLVAVADMFTPSAGQQADTVCLTVHLVRVTRNAIPITVHEGL
jgi:hypothetical protein